VLICYVENRYVGLDTYSAVFAVFARNLFSWFARKSLKLLPPDVMKTEPRIKVENNKFSSRLHTQKSHGKNVKGKDIKNQEFKHSLC